ncbi:ABC transporter ATP-binding protein [Bdellovibrio sp. HCB337]|uniref:ABC transporter ATP-binding protein n=1 Tax=Bdellovibrio sp. HCB337 TaxID=3394358 RepID=UPI0039A5EF9E
MRPLLLDVLFTRFHARILIILSSLVATVLGLFGPYFQKLFIDQMTGQTGLDFFNYQLHPLALILFAFVAVFLAQAFYQLTNYLGMSESIHLQSVFSRRLYEKTLDLRVDTMSHRPVGEIIQIYATDVPGATVFLEQTLPAGASTIFPLILAPFAISLIYDLPLMPTLVLMIGITVLNTALAFRQSRFFYRFKKLAGDRIALVNEWVQNIRTIRILGWTPFFEKNIFRTREIETINRIRMVTNGQVMNSISTSITFVLNVVTLASLIYYSKHTITSGELLALLWIVGVFLTRPFRQMPWFFTFGFDSWTSLQRLESFLKVKNETNNNHNHTPRPQGPVGALTEDVALEVQKMNLQIGGKEILKNIDLRVREGEFIAVVGEVGSGKSMLLLSLLGETGAEAEHYRIHGKSVGTMTLHELRGNYAYVPQEGFIMSASLRENVAFVYDIEPERDSDIEESLRLAQFEIFKERVENGLSTEIGERGVNLSGGQKQRVSLARVHFHKAPVLLLDDCLSAVDVDTEEKLFSQLLDGAWAERTRLLVTHRLTILHRVDRILFMQEGRIVDQGTYSELMQRSPLFREYTQSVEETLNVEA